MKKVKVNYTHNDAVAQIILDDGKGNILDSEMMEELQELLDSFHKRPTLKLITFEGAGKHFSFGASVEEHQKFAAATMLKNFHNLFFSLTHLSIPTLAKISGQCLGGGMELAIICNFMFGDKTVKMGQPEVVLGVFPPPASIILPEKIGLAKAEDLIISGRIIHAEEAEKMGLLNTLFVDREALEKGTMEWIEKTILPKSASSLRYSVKATRIKFNHVLNNFLPQLEHMYVNQLMETKDANEGIASFMEKRQPVWEHC